MQFIATFVVPSSNHLIENLAGLERRILHLRERSDPVDPLAMLRPECYRASKPTNAYMLPIFRRVCMRAAAPNPPARHGSTCPIFCVSPWSLLGRSARCHVSVQPSSLDSAQDAAGEQTSAAARHRSLFSSNRPAGWLITHFELAKLRIHSFHLFLEMVLIDRAHLLRIFCMQQPLRKLEPRSHICFGERHRLFVHFFRSRIGRANAGIGLLPQLLGFALCTSTRLPLPYRAWSAPFRASSRLAR